MDIESKSSDTSSDKSSDNSSDQADKKYCVKCKERTKSTDEGEIAKIDRQGKPYLVSKCEKCGAGKARYIKATERSDLMKGLVKESNKQKLIENQQKREAKKLVKLGADDLIQSIGFRSKKMEKNDLLKSIRLLQKSIDLIKTRISVANNDRYKELLKNRMLKLEDQRNDLMQELNDLLDNKI